MNKARAYKELQRRQTKRLSELLMTLYAAERAAAAADRRFDAGDCAAAAAAAAEPAVLLLLGGGGGGDRGCSRLSGVSNGSAAAAVLSYVATQLPSICNGGGGGQPSQRPPPPPWTLAKVPVGFRPSTSAAPGRSTTAGQCGAAGVIAPAAETTVGRCVELPRGTQSAGRWRLRRSAGNGGGGSVSNSARTPTSGESSSGSSDPGAVGEELPSSPDRKVFTAIAAETAAITPIFPTASQMRQLLSSLTSTHSRFGGSGGDFGGRAPHQPRSAVGRGLGRHPEVVVGDNVSLIPAKPPQPSMAAEDSAARPSNSTSASYPVAAEGQVTATRGAVSSTSPGRTSSRRSGGVAKQVSFVDPQPTPVLLVSPPPSPPGSPPPPPPWWCANSEAAASARRASAAGAAAIVAASEIPVPVLSEKNLQMHAAAMHAVVGVAATSMAAAAGASNATDRRKKEPAVGGGMQPSRKLDERTAAWIRERQVLQHATGATVAFSDIPEESDSEHFDLAS